MRLAILFALSVLVVPAPAAGYGAYVGASTGRAADGGSETALIYRAGAREANRLSVQRDGSDYLFADSAFPIRAESGCRQETENAARCDYFVSRVFVAMFDGDDEVEIGQVPDPLVVQTHEGNDLVISKNTMPGRTYELYDSINGGPGDDRLYGGPRVDLLWGGSGRDTVEGRRGDDVLHGGGGGSDTLVGGTGVDAIRDGDASDGESADRDVLVGGPGRDQLDYRFREAGSVRVSLDPATAGWCANEDSISAFEDVTGTARADRLTGDDARNRLVGGDGGDSLYGRGGDDILIAGNRGAFLPGYDYCYPSGGCVYYPDPDVLDGGRGRDRIRGDDGRDELRGRPGADDLNGSDGQDRVSAGAGDDRIRSADGNAERVYCGDGFDTVSADPNDRLFDCERILRRR